MNSLRNSVDLVDARGSNIFITQELKGAANQHVTHSQKRKLAFLLRPVHSLQFVELASASAVNCYLSHF